MNKPILYVFNISHYCEKARCALDYYGIDHEVRHVMVGIHRRIAKKLGAKRGSVPFQAEDLRQMMEQFTLVGGMGGDFASAATVRSAKSGGAKSKAKKLLTKNGDSEEDFGFF